MTADPSIFVKGPRHEHGLHMGEHLEELGWLAGQIWGASTCRHAFSTCGAYTPGYQSFLSFV
jgi:hypothetical protein